MTIDPRSGLTQRQAELLRTRLLEARTQLLGRAQARFRRSAGAGPTEGEVAGDAADQAEVSFEQGLVTETSEADRARLRDVEDALARMDEGRYGLCEATGEPIGVDRLLVEPWARYTRAYQEELEAAAGQGPPPSL
jgi:DnaK suppressor protein